MKDYPCEAALPDCFEDNNGFARAYGPLRIGQAYAATEEISIDRYDYYSVTLTSGTRYTLTLTFPRYDVDLYIYGNAPAYAVLAQSATTQNSNASAPRSRRKPRCLFEPRNLRPCLNQARCVKIH